MKLGTYIENIKYTLLNFTVSIKDDEIVVLEYVKYTKEAVIRQIAHPARIDKEHDTLMIDYRVSKGKNTELGYYDLCDMFQRLPCWDITKYYQLIKDGSTATHLCVSGTPVCYSR